MIEQKGDARMTSEDFCNWLSGYFELTNKETISLEQSECIQRHLRMVFIHEIDPSFGDQEHQDELNKAHNVLISIGEISYEDNVRC